MFSTRQHLDARHSANPVFGRLPFQDQIEDEERERRETYLKGLDEAGRIIPPEEYAKRDKGESQLELMGHKVAQRLERLRHNGYHNGEDCYFVGANSGTEKMIPPFWRSNANPYVQRQKRRKIFKTLSLYMQDETAAGAAFRMWVIHDGPRCHAMHLPKRWSAQAAAVTNWNESEFAQSLDVKIIFRSAEAGSPVKKASEKTFNPKTGRKERDYLRDDNGDRIPCRDSQNRQTWHPHSHLIVRFGRFLSDDEWKDVIDRAQIHFGTPKLDAGFIEDPREACKYVLKCDELEDVRDIDFLRFLKWTYKRRLVSFYGEAKQLKRDHERDGLRIKSEWDAKTQQTRYVARKSHHVKVVKKDLDKPWKPPTPEKCVLVARLDAVPYFSPISEPLFIVRGKVDWPELHKKREVLEVLEESQQPYEAALQAFPLIYGCELEDFLNGAHALTQHKESAPLGFDYVENQAVSLGSAHTPPVISRETRNASLPAKRNRAKNEQSEVPNGSPPAILSSHAAQRVEKSGLLVATPHTEPNFNASEYFGT